MYLSCVEEVIPWTFAYDRHNYARYLVPFLNDMGSLPVTMPEVHSAFKDGQFFVQMSRNNPFGHNEADKTIENTINRDWRRLVAHLWQRQISSMRLHWFFAAPQRFFCFVIC